MIMMENMTEWINTAGLVNYEAAVSEMETRVAAIRAGTKPEAIWLLEHPSLYTAGTSARAGDLLNAQFPVFQTGRGGQYTYHGPGQRIAYVMLDLQNRGGDVRKFVWQLEEWIIQTLAEFGITGERREGRIGIWVVTENSEAKIAAIGVRIRHGVTYHGVSINVDPDLSHYAGIIPCGIQEFGVTSMAQLGKKISLTELDQALKKTFEQVFINQLADG
jgi:lipoyl(octanoyl) transferase